MKNLLQFVFALALVLPFTAGAIAKVGPFQVSRVIDGDTIELTTPQGAVTVRLIGVDTPETVHPSKPVEHFGKEASAFTKRALHSQMVYLYFDQDRVDRYGRVLAYVYRSDGFFANLELIKQGFGHAYTRFPIAKMDAFRQAEKEAREAKRGLWGSVKEQSSQGDTPKNKTGLGNATVYVTKSGKKYHADGCRFLSKSKIPITLGKAAQRYGPCSTCSPPLLEQATKESHSKSKDRVEEDRKNSTKSNRGQCLATTQKGTRCKRSSNNDSDYCWQHKDRSAYGGEETKQKEQNPKAENKRCEVTTQKGTQCKRKAKSGSDYCWQHGG